LGRIEVNVILDDFVDICNFKKVMIRFGSRLVKVGVTLLPSLRTASLFPKLHFGFAEKVYPLPNIAESITEGTVAEFVKKQGEWVEQDETVANIETDKVTVEIKSPASGVLTNLFAKTGETVAVGKPLFGIDSDLPKPSGSGAKPAESKPAPKAEEAPKPAETAKPTPAPQAPKPAEVKTQTSQAPSPAPPAPSAPQAPKEAPKPQAPLPPLPTPTVFSGERLETRETMSRLRQRVSQRLKDAQNTYALLTSFQEVDMTEATKTRKVRLKV
jgi:2-oxoglutarate dehydrogenase E2 component (dihydrolipoamide succinyltransferase)